MYKNIPKDVSTFSIQYTLAGEYRNFMRLIKDITNIIDAIKAKKFNKNLSEKLVKKLMEGSSDEDILPRPINHFYDPIYQKGWRYLLFLWL